MRLLTLYMGHSIAAASTVVGAFMGGLAAGSALGGALVPRLTPRQALLAYALLEALVVLSALAMPWELARLLPLLARAYQDGAGGWLFPAVRLLSCFLLVLVPAMALGATFPVAVRWFVNDPDHPGRGGGALYAANTIGATIGVLLAGFWLIPLIGISGTTLVAMAASVASIAGALLAEARAIAAWEDALTEPLGRAGAELKAALETHMTRLIGQPTRTLKFLREVRGLSHVSGERA